MVKFFFFTAHSSPGERVFRRVRTRAGGDNACGGGRGADRRARRSGGSATAHELAEGVGGAPEGAEGAEGGDAEEASGLQARRRRAVCFLELEAHERRQDEA